MVLLKQSVVPLVEESFRNAELLQQVWQDLLCLQSSEEKLQGLVEELHVEAQHRAAVAVSLQAELHTEAKRRAALTESHQAELHAEAQRRTEVIESLHAELHAEAQSRAALDESLQAELRR